MYVFCTININSSPLLSIKRAYIIQACHMIFVRMSEQYSIQLGNVLAQHLVAEIRTGIDYDIPAFPINQYGRPQTVIFNICGGAHRTIASDDRNVLRCSRSEEHTSDLQSLMRIQYPVFCLKKNTT